MHASIKNRDLASSRQWQERVHVTTEVEECTGATFFWFCFPPNLPRSFEGRGGGVITAYSTRHTSFCFYFVDHS